MKYRFTFFLTILFISLSTGVKAQYITLDKDGYTNIRKEPGARSDIVGRVQKYQVFYFAGDIPCSDETVTDDFENWLPVTIDMENTTGYIYKKILFSVNDLPALEEETINNTFVCSNDSVRIMLTLRPFDKSSHTVQEKTVGNSTYTVSVDGGRAYGTDGWIPYKEIAEITVSYDGKTIHLPKQKFRKFYDINSVSARIGFDGELYIFAEGGDGSGGYSVCWSVVDDDIVYEIISEC